MKDGRLDGKGLASKAFKDRCSCRSPSQREREREPTMQLPWKEGFPEIVAQSLAFSPLLPDDGGINVGASFFASDIEDVKGTGGSFQSVTFSGVIYFNGG